MVQVAPQLLFAVHHGDRRVVRVPFAQAQIRAEPVRDERGDLGRQRREGRRELRDLVGGNVLVPAKAHRVHDHEMPSRSSVSFVVGAAGSAGAALEGDQDAVDTAGTDAALDLHAGDRLELPALGGVLVEDALELRAGHLAADELLAEFHDLVLEPVSHTSMMHRKARARQPNVNE